MAFIPPEALAAEFAFKAAQAGKLAGTAVIATAALIQRDAKINTPVDTGFLRASITRETRRSQFGAEAEVGPEANYGAFVENGTSRMAPQPYLVPAMLKHEDTLAEALDQIVGFDVAGSVSVSTTLPGGLFE